MADALTPIFAVAALVLCIAGVAKLRSPAGAARAGAIVGLPGHSLLVRAFALLELAVGGWALVNPTRAGAAAVAGLYLLFCVLAVALVRRQAACGCFGEAQAPASVVQAVLSAALAVVALTAVFALPHGLGWVLGRPTSEWTVLVLGTAAAAYGTVLAYTALPSAWASWSGR